MPAVFPSAVPGQIRRRVAVTHWSHGASFLIFIEHVFYHGTMASSKRDKALLAEITGVARRLARGRQLSEAEQQEAAATLSQVARGRADLLAESAGLAIGTHEGGRDEARHLQAAQLCIDAGADLSLIPHWVEEGRRRAGNSPSPLHR